MKWFAINVTFLCQDLYNLIKKAMATGSKGAFKNYVILLGGEGGSPKRSQNITGGGGGDHKKITEDHDHKGGV